MRRMLARCVLVQLLVCGACRIAGAQVIDAPSCSSTLSSLGATPRPAYADSAPDFRMLFICPVSGPPVISAMWRRTDLTTVERDRLVFYAELLLDRRISDSLIAVVRRAGSASANRQHALGALVRSLDESQPFDVDALRRNGRPSRANSLVSEGHPRAGAEPIDAPARRRIFQPFADMAAQATDPALAEIAYAGIRSGPAGGFPEALLPNNAVMLTYMCGNRFRVRNRTPMTLTLRWDVYGTTSSGMGVHPPAAPGATPPERFFTTPVRGTVRLFRGTQLLQTKANGGTTCP